MGWTVFSDSNGYWATEGHGEWISYLGGGWKWSHFSEGKLTVKEYIHNCPKDRQLTPTETRDLFKRVGTPVGKPIPSDKPAKKRGITDSQMLTRLLRDGGWLGVWSNKKYVTCKSRRDIRDAMRAKKAGGK